MKTYLGDGVYASFDGYTINLTTENGISVTNSIYMEPEVMGAFFKYVEQFKSPPATGLTSADAASG
jgi:hypothetical protein